MEPKEYDSLLKAIEIDQKNLQKQKEAVLEAQRLSRQTERPWDGKTFIVQL